MRKRPPTTVLVTTSFLLGILGNPTGLEARQVRNTTRTSVHGGARVQNTNVNIHRDIDVDVDRNYHPVARAVGVTAAAAVTAAVIGSIVYSVPASCTTIVSHGISYRQCGSTWYQPRYSGTQVSYVVVAPP